VAAGHGFNFIAQVVGNNAETIVTAALVAAIITAAGVAARNSMQASKENIIPDHRLTLRTTAELLAEFIRSLGDRVMGPENRKYQPFVASIFVYIFFSNLLGLIPGFSPPTDSVTFNLGMALTVFVLYNYWSIREIGIGGFFKHLWGPIWWLGPLLFPIEVISHGFRPFTLSLRLFANMLSDHIVLDVFTNLTKVGVPVIFYFMGAFVCFMQAFIFTMLTMIYIRLAVAHEHEEHEPAGAAGHGSHH
jgi:F-type H+-transporting ATPase subunit a